MLTGKWNYALIFDNVDLFLDLLQNKVKKLINFWAPPQKMSNKTNKPWLTTPKQTLAHQSLTQIHGSQKLVLQKNLPK